MYVCIQVIYTCLGVEEFRSVRKTWLLRFAVSPKCVWTHKNQGHMKHQRKFQGTKVDLWVIWPHKNHVKLKTLSWQNVVYLWPYVLMYVKMFIFSGFCEWHASMLLSYVVMYVIFFVVMYHDNLCGYRSMPIWPCKNHAKINTPSKNGMMLCYVLMYLCM